MVFFLKLGLDYLILFLCDSVILRFLILINKAMDFAGGMVVHVSILEKKGFGVGRWG